MKIEAWLGSVMWWRRMTKPEFDGLVASLINAELVGGGAIAREGERAASVVWSNQDFRDGHKKLSLRLSGQGARQLAKFCIAALVKHGFGHLLKNTPLAPKPSTAPPQ